MIVLDKKLWILSFFCKIARLITLDMSNKRKESKRGTKNNYCRYKNLF